MTPTNAALVYAGLTALPLAMQLALAAGAPLGRFSVGGRFAGRLPPAWRILALVQGGVLAAMAVTVLDHGGVLAIGMTAGAIWVVFALTVLTLIANAASPSRPERLLWTPVTALMALAALGTALL